MPEFDSTHVDQAIGAVKMPIGNYTNFADCVEKNRGVVGDPEAYCATIKRKVEGETINVSNEVLMSLGEIKDGMLQGAQLMPIGSWNHPLGRIDVTPERARSFAAQFKKNTTGQKLPILWIHSDKVNVSNPRYGQAAGWIDDVRADDKLGVLVDIKFTPEGERAVNNKEFAYLSAEYFPEVQLPHHESPEKDVIVAAALVNRPHLKGMNPLLNEETGHQFLLGSANQPITGGVMDKFLLQLCEKAKVTIADGQTELTEAQQTALTAYLDKGEKELKDATTKVSLLETQVATLEDPEKKRARSLEELGFKEEALLLSEYRADRFLVSLGEALPEGKALTPVAKEAARKYALSQTSENLEEFHNFLLSGKGIVDLSVRGKAGENPEEDTGAVSLADKLIDDAEKLSEEKKISLGEALSEIAKTDPKGWNEYQKSMGAPMAMSGR